MHFLSCSDELVAKMPFVSGQFLPRTMQASFSKSFEKATTLPHLLGSTGWLPILVEFRPLKFAIQIGSAST